MLPLESSDLYWFGGAAGLWALRYHTAAVVFVAIVVADLLIIKFGHMNP
ncbi:hypothetical protein [Nocardia pseudobrasiliensis]|uniref:Uncharacterized protein n=1 Tax=Nocardia pseudobrasiliensis TaxID=45979 RepID=A0A370I8Q3_9NOCA|nr:hypothetical protein [Nocardia pseudobrasiliensis]RDI66990.1 hypothetical protein DFR76_10361 [Nocardia pseudobrasiliensis]